MSAAMAAHRETKPTNVRATNAALIDSETAMFDRMARYRRDESVAGGGPVRSARQSGSPGRADASELSR